MALGYLISPVIQIEDINGKPLVGGFVRVYVHGTTIPYITHKNFDGDLNPAEVVLDNKGMCVLLAEEGNLYDVYCEDRNRVEQWSRVNVGIGGGGGSSSGINSIYSSDNSITIIQVGDTVDIKINRDGEASAICAMSDVLHADGNFQFTQDPVNSVGTDLAINDGYIDGMKKWYHYDATVQLSWNGPVSNTETDIAITGPSNSEHVSFDLSYPHLEYLDISGVYEIQNDGDQFVFAVQGLVQGMTAQVINASIHVIEMGAGGGGGGGTQVQSDWTQSNPQAVDFIKHKPDLSTVATTGDYSDLTGTPTIPTKTSDLDNDSGFISASDAPVQDVQVNSSSVVDSNGVANIDLSGYATTQDLADGLSDKQDVLTAGSNISITNNVISATASPQVQSDWAQSDSAAVDFIKSKPTEKNLVAGTNVTITENGNNVTISAVNANEVPTVTGGDNGSVLMASYSGNVGSYAWQTLTIPSYTAGNMISLLNNAIAVLTTAGITDIQIVSAMPANPVATVLYLVREP